MIPASARIDVVWLNPADLCFDPPQPLDLDKLRHYVQLMQASADTEGHLAPPLVQPAGAGRYTPRDGRHRALAHVVLGRTRIRCLVVRE